jgi:hypothetical protein
MHLGVFSSLLLMAAATAVLWSADHAFGDAAGTRGLTIVVLFLVGSVHYSCSPSRYVSGSATQSI